MRHGKHQNDAFALWLTSAATMKTIGAFGVEKFGAPLFFADAGKPEYECDVGDVRAHDVAQRDAWVACASRFDTQH